MAARRPLVLLNNRIVELPSGDTVVGGGGGGGSGTEFLTITETDLNDATYYYYGGTDGNADWKINRYLKSDLTDKTSATEATNVSYGSLAAAWAARGSLSYS